MTSRDVIIDDIFDVVASSRYLRFSATEIANQTGHSTHQVGQVLGHVHKNPDSRLEVRKVAGSTGVWHVEALQEDSAVLTAMLPDDSTVHLRPGETYSDENVKLEVYDETN